MRINKKQENSVFWISYADLMAGLMFVFLLIIGAVVVKYVLTQSDLAKARADLFVKEQNITNYQNELFAKEKVLDETFANLNQAKSQNDRLSSANEAISQTLEAVKEEKNSFENMLDDANLTINDLKQNLLAVTSLLKQKEEENDKILNALKQRNLAFNVLQQDYDDVKNKISSLGSVRGNVVKELENKLGDKAKIDPNSGVISLPDSILFDLGKWELKEESKEQLKQILQTYFDTIFSSEEILKHIDKIVIEGHTNSMGSYLYNLDLSQKRAYEVLKFIHSWNKDKRLEKYLMASGRSFNDLIYKDGVEDMNASKRIEIRFLISDKESKKDIEKFLEQQNRKYPKN
ncbi:MAG: OmpA family protein [Campylobacter sp.]